MVPSAPKAQNDLDKGRERKFARMELTVEPEPAILKDGRTAEPTEHLDHVQASPPSKSPSSDAEIVHALPPTAETQAKPIASTESSSEDEGTFDEADIAEHEEKYRDKKSRLEAKKADLSAHEDRYTSPLLQLSLLAALRQVVSQIDFKRLDRSKAVPLSTPIISCKEIEVQLLSAYLPRLNRIRVILRWPNTKVPAKRVEAHSHHQNHNSPHEARPRRSRIPNSTTHLATNH